MDGVLYLDTYQTYLEKKYTHTVILLKRNNVNILLQCSGKDYADSI